MRFSQEFKIFAGIFLILFLAVFTTGYWHSLATKPAFTEMQLKSFDKKIAENDACFNLNLEPNNFDRKKIEKLNVTVNKKILIEKKIDVSQKQTLNECFSSEELESGDNIVFINLGNDRVFYHIQKTDFLEQQNPKISIVSANENEIVFKIENNDLQKYEPATILVNGKKDHSVFPSKKNQEFSEKLSLQPGENNVKIVFGNQSEETIVQKKETFHIPLVLSLAIIAGLLSVLFLFVFAKKNLLERTAYSIASFFGFMGVIPFILLNANIFSAELMALITVFFTLGLAFYFKKNFQKNKIKIRKLSYFEILLIGFILFSALFFHLFTENYVSLWTSFYERQATLIAQTHEIPVIDPFSELGTKPFGYVSGYFFINAALQVLTGLPGSNIFPIITLLAGTMILVSMLLLLKELKIETKIAYLITALFFMSGFIFGDLMFNIRHTISFSFMLLALAVFLKENNKITPGILLAFAGFMQPLLLAFFGIIGVVLLGFKKIVPVLKQVLIASVLVLISFSQVILRHGFVTQANASVWGYNFGMPWPGVILDTLAMSLFSLIVLMPMFLTKKIKLNHESKKILATVLILALVQTFISYRVNIATALLFALFIAKTLPEKIFKQKFAEHALSLALILGLITTFTAMTMFSTPASEIEMASFLKENTSTEANFLVEPALGHSVVFLTERKILSDLAVEYADSEKINESFEFLQTGKNVILKKHGIKYVVNRSIFIESQPVGSNLQPEKIEFEQLDKIYSNGSFYVHLRS